MNEGYLIASGILIFISFISLITGGYYTDKYIQLLSLTKRQSIFMKTAIKILLFLVFLPTVLIFISLNLIKMYVSSSINVEFSEGIFNEIGTKSLTTTCLILAYFILIVIYAVFVMRSKKTKVLFLRVPAMFILTLVIAFFSKSIIIASILGCIMSYLLILYTSRKNFD